MQQTAPDINSSDRLCFTVFVAIAVHAALILGIGFEILTQADQSPVIEVTLAHNPSEKAPEDADFMAQENQLGGGELEEKALPTITQTTEFIEQHIQEVSPETPPEAQPDAPTRQVEQVTTLNAEQQVISLQQDIPLEDKMLRVDQEISLLERSLNLASLDAKLDTHEQFQTKKTRVHRISSVAALKTLDAYYVKQWITKIHRVGKLNYPEEARRRKLYGSLRLVVTLVPNGSVRDIQVLRSSGHKILDDAAIRIVRLAEPFAPFPEHLRKEYDQLEITRTWQFSKDGHSPVL